MRRFACVWVPYFAAAAAERAEPTLRDRPFAIVTGAPPATRVSEASAAAREQGVTPGMAEGEARTRCPLLLTRGESPERCASARQALLEAALAVSPRIEDAGPGLVHVDLQGLTRLLGAERAIGDRLARLGARVGLPPRIGIAGSRIAARVAAVQATARVSVIPPGGDGPALARAPLSMLALSADLAATLARWGLVTLGDLAALPRAGLADRLGVAGLRAHDMACGLDREPFQSYAPPPFWEEAIGLEWEIDTLPALRVALERVLARLAARLEAAHVAAESLSLQLQLTSGAGDDRAVPLAYPMREVAPMLAVLGPVLEARPPVAAVTRIALGAAVVSVRPLAAGLWQPAAPAGRDLAAVLTRLVALVGVEHVGSPVLADSHRPDAFVLARFAPPSTEAAGGGPPAPGTMVLRRLRPPRRVEVETETTAGRAEARPVRVHLERRALRVLASAGPWRGAGEWWDASGWARDEWDVELADGRLCLLVHDPATATWSLDGMYD